MINNECPSGKKGSEKANLKESTQIPHNSHFSTDILALLQWKVVAIDRQTRVL